MRAECLLAIDCSTERLNLAACGPSGAVCWSGIGGAQASQVLLAQALELLRELGLSLSQLDAIAFANGPGAFTGLRTACSVAQGLAFALDHPVLPIDSLMVVAEAERLRGTWLVSGSGDLAVVMDARMGEVYAARYAWRDPAWQTLDAPALWHPDDLRRAWRHANPRAWAGSGLHYLGLDDPPPAHAESTDDRRASALMSLARRQWAQAAAVHPRDAHPLYLRDKVALTTAERSALAYRS